MPPAATAAPARLTRVDCFLLPWRKRGDVDGLDENELDDYVVASKEIMQSEAWTQIFRPMLVNDLELDKRCEVRLSSKLVQNEIDFSSKM